MPSLRERVRAEMIDEIKDVARRQLASEGANLSLRAIARELGMVSSAIYRYFASRDDLLTALIIDGYTSLAHAVVAAERPVPRSDLAHRFNAAAEAIHQWAKANRAEYALLYGSPVPGYVAPQETVIPVIRLNMVLVDILRDGVGAGVLTAADDEPLPPTVHADISAMLGEVDRTGIPPGVLTRGLAAWAALFGLVSLELWGHLVGLTTDYDGFFTYQLGQLNRMVGIS